MNGDQASYISLALYASNVDVHHLLEPLISRLERRASKSALQFETVNDQHVTLAQAAGQLQDLPLDIVERMTSLPVPASIHTSGLTFLTDETGTWIEVSVTKTREIDDLHRGLLAILERSGNAVLSPHGDLYRPHLTIGRLQAKRSIKVDLGLSILSRRVDGWALGLKQRSSKRQADNPRCLPATNGPAHAHALRPSARREDPPSPYDVRSASGKAATWPYPDSDTTHGPPSLPVELTQVTEQDLCSLIRRHEGVGFGRPLGISIFHADTGVLIVSGYNRAFLPRLLESSGAEWQLLLKRLRGLQGSTHSVPALIGLIRQGIAPAVNDSPTHFRSLVPKPFKLAGTGGCFDNLHDGHRAFFRSCFAVVERLVVFLNTDSDVARLKGSHRPWQTFDRRRDALRSALRPDDVIVSYDETDYVSKLQTSALEVYIKGTDYWELDVREATDTSPPTPLLLVDSIIEYHSTDRGPQA